MIKKIFMSAIFSALLLVGISSTTYAAAFNDVPSGHWAYNSVNQLAREGIIKPDSKGNFNGNLNVTRYDMAVILAGILNKTPQRNIAGSNPFSDVPKNNPAYDAVAKMAALGVMEGYADGTFKGYNEISRLDLAITLNTFLNKCGKPAPSGLSSSFTDIPPTHWAYNAVSRLATDGIIGGYGAYFRGNNKITRFELAMIILKVNEKYFS